MFGVTEQKHKNPVFKVRVTDGPWLAGVPYGLRRT